ncbi:hypothetical protein PR202_ga04157 [Eleusine coracana subsp. coracana]|uniref:Uncharacterized protein n=1 Tax=Eleusine coracana subsp. coracana TaxID=191504 RepID=A0AAV5BR04_ELECO|nr:hypothetical protein PR202_ga04157 [Eleusine coracana subsp. coracana]
MAAVELARTTSTLPLSSSTRLLRLASLTPLSLYHTRPRSGAFLQRRRRFRAARPPSFDAFLLRWPAALSGGTAPSSRRWVLRAAVADLGGSGGGGSEQPPPPPLAPSSSGDLLLRAAAAAPSSRQQGLRAAAAYLGGSGSGGSERRTWEVAAAPPLLPPPLDAVAATSGNAPSSPSSSRCGGGSEQRMWELAAGPLFSLLLQMRRQLRAADLGGSGGAPSSPSSSRCDGGRDCSGSDAQKRPCVAGLLRIWPAPSSGRRGAVGAMDTAVRTEADGPRWARMGLFFVFLGWSDICMDLIYQYTLLVDGFGK